jgi:hypothetical protein
MPVLVSPVKYRLGAPAVPALSETSVAMNVPSSSHSEIQALFAPFRIFMMPADVSAHVMYGYVVAGAEALLLLLTRAASAPFRSLLTALPVPFEITMS